MGNCKINILVYMITKHMNSVHQWDMNFQSKVAFTMDNQQYSVIITL